MQIIMRLNNLIYYYEYVQRQFLLGFGFAYISILMRIKISKQKARKQSNTNSQTFNPESKKRIQPRKGIVFQSQFKSIQNYFSLMNHILGRDVRTKQILKKLTKNEIENQQSVNILITDIADYNEKDAFEATMVESTISEIHQSPQRSIPKNQRYDIQRPKWKESILRRKNNGSHGEIMKGNPKNNHSRLMSRINWTEENFQLPSKQTEKLTKDDFVPVGNMQQSRYKNNFCYKGDVRSQADYKPKAKLCKSPVRQIGFIKNKKSSNVKGQERQVMSRTCFPLKNSMQMSDSMMTIRKSIVSTPHRYKSRMSTPCPWDYTTHR